MASDARARSFGPPVASPLQTEPLPSNLPQSPAVEPVLNGHSDLLEGTASGSDHDEDTAVESWDEGEDADTLSGSSDGEYEDEEERTDARTRIREYVLDPENSDAEMAVLRDDDLRPYYAEIAEGLDLKYVLAARRPPIYTYFADESSETLLGSLSELSEEYFPRRGPVFQPPSRPPPQGVPYEQWAALQGNG
ncbi:hypothetical protein K488DRAFT_92261 [Vararia minispora EC-137]|uniref:Uncharacterized protein n=1 Tax=Vararia minispora EC-137 TaxID=1314806 RepID=A0ACB8Q497_9AGAM|nr:hypothetical protein K488DRAFT_92261 [Vararia minispora EC-137]